MWVVRDQTFHSYITFSTKNYPPEDILSCIKGHNPLQDCAEAFQSLERSFFTVRLMLGPI